MILASVTSPSLLNVTTTIGLRGMLLVSATTLKRGSMVLISTPSPATTRPGRMVTTPLPVRLTGVLSRLSRGAPVGLPGSPSDLAPSEPRRPGVEGAGVDGTVSAATEGGGAGVASPRLALGSGGGGAASVDFGEPSLGCVV